MLLKKDGFKGERSVVLPRSIIMKVEQNRIVNSLYLTDIGYYPAARFHFCERKTGIDQHILIFVVEGKGCIYTDGSRHYLTTGQYYIIPALHPHSYQADPDEPWSIYWVHFKGAKSRLLSDIFIRKYASSKYVQLQMENRIQAFEEILSVLSCGYGDENILYANMSMWYLLGGFIYGDFLLNLKMTSVKDPVRESIEFMSANLHRVLNLEEIAGNAEYSVSHFSKLFTTRTGHSPINYFTHLKMQKACKMLDFSGMKIKEIGLKLGFTDPYYFSRVFTKVMSLSPKQYRERLYKA